MTHISNSWSPHCIWFTSVDTWAQYSNSNTINKVVFIQVLTVMTEVKVFPFMTATVQYSTSLHWLHVLFIIPVDSGPLVLGFQSLPLMALSLHVLICHILSFAGQVRQLRNHLAYRFYYMCILYKCFSETKSFMQSKKKGKWIKGFQQMFCIWMVRGEAQCGRDMGQSVL